MHMILPQVQYTMTRDHKNSRGNYFLCLCEALQLQSQQLLIQFNIHLKFNNQYMILECEVSTYCKEVTSRHGSTEIKQLVW